jgi:hypothetical protein
MVCIVEGSPEGPVSGTEPETSGGRRGRATTAVGYPARRASRRCGGGTWELRVIRFDSAALWRALDAQREARGLTWSQVAAETGVSTATLTRTRQGGRMEVDGVLAMTAWLDRTVESFTRRTAT